MCVGVWAGGQVGVEGGWGGEGGDTNPFDTLWIQLHRCLPCAPVQIPKKAHTNWLTH